MTSLRKAAVALLSKPTSSSSSSTLLLLETQLVHLRAIKAGLAQTIKERLALVNLYLNAHFFDHARKVFDEMPHRDTVAWTALISACSRNGQHANGMRVFADMLSQGFLPDGFVLASVLKCCAGVADMNSGKMVHGWMLRNGVHLDVVLQNSVLDLYVKCGDYEGAKRVFRAMDERDTVSWNIVIGTSLQNGDVDRSMQLFDESPFRDVSSWNTIISGLMRKGHDMAALDRLHQMALAGPAFNHYTYSTALALAGTLALLNLGRQLHGRILRAALEPDAFVFNSLMDMYCKCGVMESALLIFDGHSHLATYASILWSMMVAGYVQNGREEEALELFRRMLREGVSADKFTLTSAAAACANAGMVEPSRQVHACAEKSGHGSDTHLTSALIDMYAKCGSLDDARRIFDGAHTLNVALWTSMLCSYASHGRSKMAIELFNQMIAERITPNEVTLVGVLSACSHGGLVTEGREYFKSMKEAHGIVPTIEHYTCMVDLFGRAGLLDKAKNFIVENNIGHHAVVWKAFLASCRLHKHTEYAKFASEQLLQLEPRDAGSFILLSNMYASDSRWLDTSNLRYAMQERGVRKQPGRSWIHLKGLVHTCAAGDRSSQEQMRSMPTRTS